MRTLIAAAIVAAATLQPARAAQPAPDTPLVKRGDVVVTVQDFNGSLARLNEEQRFSYRGNLERLTSAVSAIYVARELAREAREAGIDREPEIRTRLQLQEEALLAQVFMERFEKSIKTPDYEARAREIYRSDPEHYKIPEKVKLRHILVSFQGRTKEEARRRAEEARGKMLAKGPFYPIVREYSNDPSARAGGGEIGPAAYSSLPTELAQAARKMQPGEVSGLIESADGYSVIELLDRKAAGVIPFEAAKKSLIADEEKKYRRGVMDKKLGEITQSKEITIYTDNIAAMKTEVDAEALRRMHEDQAKSEAAAR